LETAIATAVVGWDAFHASYDRWRATGGPCERDAARTALARFAVDFTAVVAQADAIVRPSAVRPLAERFIDAAVAEGETLNDLASSWIPYATAVWNVFDQRVGRADDLRRQVRSSLDELNLEYGVR
jgi:hypothetical protein